MTILRAAMVALWVSACGGGSGDDLFGNDGPDAGADGGEGSDGGAGDAALVGSWHHRDCANRDVTELTVTGTTFALRMVVYASGDATCAAAQTYLDQSATYVVGGPMPAVANATKVDLTSTSTTMTFTTQALVDDYNARSFCGYSTWQVGVAKDVSGRTCTDDGATLELPPVGTRIYDIYDVDGERLYLGDTVNSGDGTSDGSRPTSFSSRYFTKQ